MEPLPVVPVVVPETEVPAKPQRRLFSAEYKQNILQEVDRCTEPGEVSALRRREGLYSSHLATWRKARNAGELNGLSPKKRGPAATRPDSRDREIAELKRQLAKTTARAERAEALVELQKKSPR